jgi:hypothetical protein
MGAQQIRIDLQVTQSASPIVNTRHAQPLICPIPFKSDFRPIDRFGGFETTEKDSFDPEFASFSQKWFAKHSQERQRRHLGIGRKNSFEFPEAGQPTFIKTTTQPSPTFRATT